MATSERIDPDGIIGYQYTSYDEDGEIAHRFFWCEYHVDPSECQGEGWRAIRARDTWEKFAYYVCDRMGCELTWHQVPLMRHDESSG